MKGDQRRIVDERDIHKNRTVTHIRFLIMASLDVPTMPIPASDDIMNEIIEHLFVGGIQSSETKWNEFDMIVNCTKTLPFHIRGNTVECIRIPINDDPDESHRMLKYMKDTSVLEQIHWAIRHQKNVLVHCRMGSQRSCALIACYLIKYCNTTVSDAMDHVRSRRPMAFFGGANFIQAIQEFHRKRTP